MDFVSESRLYNIIQDSISNFMLTESQESKSISAAKKLVMQRFGYDEQEADDFVRIKLRSDIPELRTPQGGKFILGVTRMFCDGEITDGETINRINTTLKYVSSDAHINEYDRNLNGMSAQELIDKFASNVEMDLENDRTKIDAMQFNGISDYDIVRIDSFEQAFEYCHYTTWCVTHSQSAFNSYTNDGINQFYFCLKKGFEQVPKKQSEGCPLDEYGLSMIAVSVDENGSMHTCTCRWNHDYGGNDHIMNTEEISNVIKMKFYQAFKPNNLWKERLNKALQLLANGEDPRNVFEDYGEFKEGFMRVKLNRKWNFINQNGEFLSKKWYDSCCSFNEGFAIVKLGYKNNFIDQKGKLLSDKWFDYCSTFRNGFGHISIKDKYNFIDRNGNILYRPNEPDQWFDDSYSFNEDFAVICLNGRWNYICANGEFLSDQWFGGLHSFNEGFGVVYINDKWNYLTTNGELLSDQWFSRAEDFRNGHAYVEMLNNKKYNIIYSNGELLTKDGFDWCNRYKLDDYTIVQLHGKFNLIDQNGKYFSDQWFDNDLYDFRGGYMVVSLNNKWNFIDTDGNYLSDQWFDYCSQFYEGFAGVMLNGKENFINQNGELLSPNQWFDWCGGFSNGYAQVRLNNEVYLIDKYGNITNRSLGESYIRKAIYESIIRFIRNDRIQ